MIAADPHDIVRPLRPQEFGAVRHMTIADPIVEPDWPGVRVLASIGGGRASLWIDGEPIEEHHPLRVALERATAATAGEGAIIDGYVTKQIVSEGVGVTVGVYDYPSLTGTMSRMLVGGRRNRLDDVERRRAAEIEDARFDETDTINLVLVDLLWLDGQWLLDVPLLERRRVLESVVPASQLVRPGLFVREPLGSWIGSWRAQGFRGMTFKAANSRYRPGETATDWTRTDLPRR